MTDDAVRDALVALAQAQARAEATITGAQARLDEGLEAVGHALVRLADSVAHMNRGVDRLAEGTASAVEAMRATQALLSADIHALIRRLDALIEGRGNGGARA